MLWQVRLNFQYFGDERPSFGRFRLELLGPCCGEKMGINVTKDEARNLVRNMIRESRTLSCMACPQRYSFSRAVRASSDYVSTRGAGSLDSMKETLAAWLEAATGSESLESFVAADRFMDSIAECVANPPSVSKTGVLTFELALQ